MPAVTRPGGEIPAGAVAHPTARLRSAADYPKGGSPPLFAILVRSQECPGAPFATMDPTATARVSRHLRRCVMNRTSSTRLAACLSAAVLATAGLTLASDYAFAQQT